MNLYDAQSSTDENHSTWKWCSGIDLLTKNPISPPVPKPTQTDIVEKIYRNK